MPKSHNVLRGSYHNILKEYDRADERAHAAGWQWYPSMRTWCEVIAKLHGLHTERVIGMFAVLSPMITVEQCKRAVIEVLETGTTDLNYPANVEKARAVQAGVYEAVQGQKVEAFAEAIDHPWGDSNPVIDRHATSVYMGKTVNDKQRGGLARKKVFNRIVGAYRKAARERQVPVHVMQAIVWESYREREVAV